MHLVEFNILARRELCKRICCDDNDEINYFKKNTKNRYVGMATFLFHFRSLPFSFLSIKP